MNFLKKWINCMVLGITGVLGLLLSLCSGMKTHASAMGQTLLKSTVKAHEVVTDGSLVTEAKRLGVSSEFGLLKAFSIIGVIVSIILVIYAIVLLLKNLNVIKCENKAFDIVSLVLPVLTLVVMIAVLICLIVYANALKEVLPTSLSHIASIPVNVITLSIKIGLYQPIMLAISIIAVIIIGTFAFLKAKKG